MTRRTERQLFAVAGALALAALALTVWVYIQGVPLPGDVRLARAIQARDSFGSVARAVNFAGSWNWVPFVAAFAIVLSHGQFRRFRWQTGHAHREAVYGFIAALGLRFADQLLKALLGSPRPNATYGIRVDHILDSYGFPSGHVYGDVIFLGTMAVFAGAYLPRRLVAPVRVALLVVILLSGPARVYVGAHWPSDTAGGYLWGSAALCLAVGYGKWAARAAAR